MLMRIVLLVIGFLLLGFGIWAVAGPGTYLGHETVREVGSMSLKASRHRSVPEWLGVAGIVVGGLVLIGAVASGRKR